MAAYDPNLFYDFQLSQGNDITWRLFKGGWGDQGELVRGIVDSTVNTISVSHEYSGLTGFMGEIGKGVSDFAGTVSQLGSDVNLGNSMAAGIGSDLVSGAFGDANQYRVGYNNSAKGNIAIRNGTLPNKVQEAYDNVVRAHGSKSQAYNAVKTALGGNDNAAKAWMDATRAANKAQHGVYQSKQMAKNAPATISGPVGDLMGNAGKGIAMMLNNTSVGQSIVDTANNALSGMASTELGSKILNAAKGMFSQGGQLLTTFDSIKVFRGTKVDFAVPQLQTRLIYGVGIAEHGVRTALIKLLDSFCGNESAVVGSTDKGQVIGMQLPPLGYTPMYGSIGDSVNNPKTFCLVYGGHIYKNLILTGFSATVSTIKVRKCRGVAQYGGHNRVEHEPLYADITIQLDKAQAPVKKDIINFLNGK